MNQKISYLVPPETLKQLARRSDFKGLVQLCAHMLLLLATVALVSMMKNNAGFLPAMLLHGIVLIFVFAPLHETIHRTAFESRWLNNAVATIFGFILFLPVQFFRAYHYAHHRHTQNPEKDPELIDKKPLTRSALLWHVSGLPVWWWQLQMIWRHARGNVEEPYLNARTHSRIMSEARFHLGFYLLVFILSLINSSDWILWYWLVPLLLAQPFLRLYLMAEHGGCDLSDNMLENSRTTYAGPLINFLAWNMPYHAEHHYRTAVPFHALPALHAYSGQSLKYRGDGYPRVLRELIGNIMRDR